MAKAKQRLTRRSKPAESDGHRDNGNANLDSRSLSTDGNAWVIWSRRIAVALIGGVLVYVGYYPSDSVQVENGDALWFCLISLLILTLTMATEPALRSQCGARSVGQLLGRGLLVDLMVWNLATWVMIAAFATCPPGNLRAATNEAWLWVSGAAMITSGRRLFADFHSRAMVLSILIAVSTGLAVHAIHQNHVSLPRTRAEFLEDPDRVLQQAGILAPRQSSRRMIFASRLNDGGPTATFALANSLAAALMLSIIAPALLMKHEFASGMRLGRLLVPLLLLVVGGYALITTASRSAIAACLAGVTWLWIRKLTLPDALVDRSQIKTLKTALMAVLGMGLVGLFLLVGVILFGDEEWMETAHPSLQFRLRYWKGTLEMLAAHPVLGSGPGGFQSMYLQYRMPIADETIVDPHNFWFETLATGGSVGGLLLVALIYSMIRENRQRSCERSETQTNIANSNSVPSDAIWMITGALCALVLIWLIALAAARLPDLEASLFVIPLGSLAGWLLWKRLSAANDQDLDSICGALVVGLLIHLSFSGGWTVPGVALPLWIGGAILARSSDRFSRAGSIEDLRNDTKSWARISLGGFLLGVCLLLTLRFASIGPVQASQFSIRRAEDALLRGAHSRADSESSAAVTADPWGYEASVWRSRWLSSQLVQGTDESRLRDLWQESAKVAIERSGTSPLVLRTLGEQSLHHYQRYGRPGDLDQADRWMSEALWLNPTDAGLNAQLALISSEKSDPDRFAKYRDRAWELSLLGGNIVRHLDLKQVLVTKPIGPSVAEAPRFSPASKLLAERE